MHGVCIGVVKLLFFYWFQKANKEETFSLKDKIGDIEIRIKSIRPPSFIPCHPRPLATWNLWRCHEYFTFIVYYSLFVFRGIMKQEYLDHLTDLVVSLEILLSKNIIKSELGQVEILLKRFVKNMNVLYDASALTSGIHELLHLVDCTINFGPLNSTNCFQFEELNRKIMQLIKGRDLIGEEFFKLFTILQSLCNFVSLVKFTNPILYDFVTKYSIIKSSNKKYKTSSNFEIKITSKKISIVNKNISDLIEYYDTTKIYELFSINRCYTNNILFTDDTNDSKFCDYFVFDNISKKYGSIKTLIHTDNKVYCILSEYSVFKNYSPFECPHLISNGFICNKTSLVFVSSLEKVEKCFMQKLTENLVFVNTFKMHHIFT